MKILVLCYEYPPIGGGGGRVAQTVSEALVRRGHQVRVQTAALGFESVRSTINGVSVFRTLSGRSVPDTCRVHEMGLYCATSFLPAIRHVHDWRPDVIHAHFAMPTGALAWVVHRATRIPYVLTAHLGDVPGGVPDQTDHLFRIIGPAAQRIWRDAATATAVSSFVQQLAEKSYQRKVERILNGIDLSDATPPSSLNEVRHFVFAGRFNAQKRPEFLIDALAKLQSTNWRFTMIGDGPLMPAVRERVNHHGLGKRVILTGWLDAAGVEGVLKSADIFLLPSSSEGLPVAAIEALKYGLAIAASDIPGVWDIVEDGVNGFRLPLESLNTWAAQLDQLLQSPDRLVSMKEASFAKARDFDLDHIAGQYEATLQSAQQSRS